MNEPVPCPWPARREMRPFSRLSRLEMRLLFPAPTPPNSRILILGRPSGGQKSLTLQVAEKLLKDLQHKGSQSRCDCRSFDSQRFADSSNSIFFPYLLSPGKIENPRHTQAACLSRAACLRYPSLLPPNAGIQTPRMMTWCCLLLKPGPPSHSAADGTSKEVLVDETHHQA